LREGQRRFAEMEPVEIGAVARLVRPHAERRPGIALGEMLADGRRLRHPRVAVDHERDGAERVELEVVARKIARRKRQHLEAIRNADFLERP